MWIFIDLVFSLFKLFKISGNLIIKYFTLRGCFFEKGIIRVEYGN